MQVHEQLPVRIVLGDLVGPVHGQRGLADSGGARYGRDGHRCRVGRAFLADRLQREEFRAAAGEPGHRRRQLRGRQLGRPRDRRPAGTGRGRGRDWCRGQGCGRQVQRRVLAQDGDLHVPQRLAGLQAQLLVQLAPQPLESGQRVRLPAAPVKREHQLRADLLIQRVFGGQFLKLGQQLRMLADREPGLSQRPLDRQLQHVQPLGLALQPDQAGDVRQRPPAPEFGRRLQLLTPSAGSCACVPWRRSRSATWTSVPPSPRSRTYPGGRATITDFPGRTMAEIGDVALQGVRRRRRNRRSPDRIDQLIGPDDLAGPQRERGQHRSTAESRHRLGGAIHHDVDRSKQAYLHDKPPFISTENFTPLLTRARAFSGSGRLTIGAARPPPAPAGWGFSAASAALQGRLVIVKRFLPSGLAPRSMPTRKDECRTTRRRRLARRLTRGLAAPLLLAGLLGGLAPVVCSGGSPRGSRGR